MPCYIVTYDLSEASPEKYKDAHDRIKSYGTWAYITESSWAVVTAHSAVQVRDHIGGVLKRGDTVLVGVLTRPAAWAGVSDDVTEWLRQHNTSSDRASRRGGRALRSFSSRRFKKAITHARCADIQSAFGSAQDPVAYAGGSRTVGWARVPVKEPRVPITPCVKRRTWRAPPTRPGRGSAAAPAIPPSPRRLRPRRTPSCSPVRHYVEQQPRRHESRPRNGG